MIDSHVHCRDWNEKHKETIEHALKVAEDSGLSAIFDMPNTTPVITSRELVEKRIADAKKCNSKLFYYVLIGMTTDEKQIKEAVETWDSPSHYYNLGVVGMKMFAGKSVGDLAIVGEEDQKIVYKTLAKHKYSGALAVHCEKESFMKSELWNIEKPSSHNDARPEESEIESIKDQIRFAEEAGFEGNLHICHVSTPESVDIIEKARDKINITCGVTPHHLLLDTLGMDTLRNGILYKVNPPLRKPETRKRLLKYFLEGRIDILESDHAPHTYDEKMNEYLSGIPNLASWPTFLKLLKNEGAGEELLERMGHDRVNRIYGTNIPRLNFPLKNRVNDYVFDPYKPLK